MKKKKVIKIRLITLIMFVFLAFATPVFGRYVYNVAKDLYLTSKKFYFTSDLLNINNPTYTFSNWGGSDTYLLNLQLNSYNNELQRLDYDLNYTITCSVNKPTLVDCAIGTADGSNTLNGVIFHDTNISKLAIYIIPKVALNQNEEIVVTITAEAKGEFEKSISAKMKIKVSEQTTNVKIIDEENNYYAVLELTNPNVTSTDVTLEFDPRIVTMDLNSDAYINRKSMEVDTINNSNYVKKVVFNIPKETTVKIKFYKEDKTMNYTYPKQNGSSIINVIYNQS